MVEKIKAYGHMVETLTFEEAMEQLEYFNDATGQIVSLYPMTKGGYELVGLSEEANVDSVYVTTAIAKRLIETGKAVIEER